jgi:hypothetical protein
MEIISDQVSQRNLRSNFLTILCILSVIGIALWIVRDIRMYNEYMAMEGVLNTESFLVGIALNLIGLSGVVLMWYLKKAGFYIYTISQMVWIVLPMVIGTWADTYYGFLILPAITVTPSFMVMYALNLKQMGR